MRAKPKHRFSEFIVGLAALTAAVLSITLIVWMSIDRMERVDAGDRQARVALAEIDTLDKGLLGQEASVRAYVVAAHPQFLEDYWDDHAITVASLSRLQAMTVAFPQQRRRVATLATLSNRWTDSVALPEIAFVQAGAVNRARAMVQAQSGERQMHAIHEAFNELRAREGRILFVRAQAQAQAFVVARWTLVLGAMGAFLVAALLGGRSLWFLVRSRDAAEAASRAKTQFLTNMSHEIRTPLNGVSGVADALARTGLTPDQMTLLDTIRQSAGAVDLLLGDLLALSRDECDADAQIAPLDLRTLVQHAVQEFRAAAEAKGLALVTHMPDEMNTWVEGDATRISRILNRLLSNAVKFTEHGGVTLGVNVVGLTRWRFEVIDSGVGFDAERVDELFDPFAQSDGTSTRRHGGAGLGLAIARQSAKTIGARLDCTSAIGQGSTFILELDMPRAAPQSEAKPTTHGDLTEVAAAGDDDTPVRVLIVDDHPTNRRVLELILEQVGAQWVSVEDGEQAVKAAASNDFSAILMDIQMPVMDGITATREIRKAERAVGRVSTPVIIVSANCQTEQVQEGVAAGAQRHLSKPVNAQILIDTLSDVLGEQRQAA